MDTDAVDHIQWYPAVNHDRNRSIVDIFKWYDHKNPLSSSKTCLDTLYVGISVYTPDGSQGALVKKNCYITLYMPTKNRLFNVIFKTLYMPAGDRKPL